MSKRSGFTLVEILIVVLVISILVAIAVPSWLKVRETTQDNACAANRREITQAKLMWQQDQHRPATDVATPADLVEYITKFPRCPSSGTYTIGDGNTEVHCTVHYP